MYRFLFLERVFDSDDRRGVRKGGREGGGIKLTDSTHRSPILFQHFFAHLIDQVFGFQREPIAI